MHLRRTYGEIVATSTVLFSKSYLKYVPLSIIYFNPSGANAVVDASMAPDFTVTYFLAGTYTATCTYTDSQGNVASDSMDVVVTVSQGKRFSQQLHGNIFVEDSLVDDSQQDTAILLHYPLLFSRQFEVTF